MLRASRTTSSNPHLGSRVEDGVSVQRGERAGSGCLAGGLRARTSGGCSARARPSTTQLWTGYPRDMPDAGCRPTANEAHFHSANRRFCAASPLATITAAPACSVDREPDRSGRSGGAAPGQGDAMSSARARRDEGPSSGWPDPQQRRSRAPTTVTGRPRPTVPSASRSSRDADRQGIDREGLGHHLHARVERPLPNMAFSGIARDEQHLQVRTSPGLGRRAGGRSGPADRHP